ncbi:hypothetical protein DBT_1743 [Dissulfuribacter thermophilus]|uniref:Uncharacterized protein n=1 Tax=Dissulfuribacter thermophilus TaxID=1156395 RepID=A0A1B9F4U0_9BACT|nr:hypothetical protein DBT_1743 [Dissulfuribacter thermophilus]
MPQSLGASSKIEPLNPHPGIKKMTDLKHLFTGLNFLKIFLPLTQNSTLKTQHFQSSFPSTQNSKLNTQNF